MMETERNRMTLEQFLEASAEQAAKLSIEELALIYDEINVEATRTKALTARLAQSLAIRYGERAAKQRAADNKPTGTLHFSDGNYDIRCDAQKQVEWDQAQLTAAFDQMTPANAQHYCKAKFEVEERKFTAAPPEIRKLLEPARTVKTDAAKFTITRKE
jgi:hypothetical protein